MSAPTVDRPGAPVTSGPPPWPLRVLAAIGRFLLRVRRRIRRLLRTSAGVADRVGRSPLVAGPIAALSVAVVGLAVVALPVAGAWWGGVEAPGPWQDAVAVTGSIWVIAYGVPVRLMGVDYSLIPLGLLLIPAWLGHQAGRWLVRVVQPNRWATVLAAWLITAGLGTAIVAGVSVLADIPAVQTSARYAVVASAIVGAVAIGTGIWRSSTFVQATLSRLPVLLGVVLRAAAIATAALLAFASGVLLVAVASSFGEISALFTALAPTFSDTIVLTLLSVAYLPTLVIWALSYLLGAGVGLGPEALLSPFVPAIAPTSLPAFPPLAALPETSAPFVWLLPALAVLAGGLAGLAVSRFASQEGPLVRLSLGLASAVLAAGAVLGLLLAGTGSLGDGRLAQVGPDAALGGLLAGVCLAIGALPASVVRAKRRQRPLQPVASDADRSDADPGKPHE